MKTKFWSAAVLACALITLTGCSKKQPAAAAEEAPAAEAAAPAPAAPAAEAPATQQRLSPAEAVRDAMEKRKYQDAVRLVLQLQATAQNEQQAQEAASLKQEVKLGLMDVAARDRQAYEALGMLRATTLAR